MIYVETLKTDMDELDMDQKHWYKLPGPPPPKLPPSTENKSKCMQYNIEVVNNLLNNESQTYRFVSQSQDNFHCSISCI